MLTYCLKCKRNTKNIDSKMLKNKNGRLNLSSKCAACGSKKQESEGLLSNLVIETALSKIPFLNILF